MAGGSARGRWGDGLVCNQFDRRLVPTSACQFCVAGEQRGVQRLGERNICSVVGGQRIAQLPDAWQKRSVLVAFDDQIGKIVERLFGSGECNFFALYQATQNLSHFNIEQMRSVESLRSIQGAHHQRFRSPGAQEYFE
jgi:hypothetical protein